MNEEIEFFIIYSLLYGALMMTRVMGVIHSIAGIQRFRMPVVVGILLASIHILRASFYVGIAMLTAFLASEIILYRSRAKGTGVWP